MFKGLVILISPAPSISKTADAVIDGTITPEEGDELLDGVEDHWGSGIPWTGIIIGGMVGIGALAALYIFMKTK